MNNRINKLKVIVILIFLCVSSLPEKHQSLPPSSHLNHHINPDHHHLSRVMAEPGIPLSGEDLVTLLFKHTNEALGSERKYVNEVIKTERDHTTEKLSIFAASYNQRCNNLYDSIEKIAANQSMILKKMGILEHKMNTSVDILEEAIASVNLKAHTCSLYQENLLYKLKSSLYDTLSTISTDKCCPCGNKERSKNNKQQHLVAEHSLALPRASDSSPLVSNIDNTHDDLYNEVYQEQPSSSPPVQHLETVYDNQSFPHGCSMGDQSFSSTHLNIHVEESHVTRDLRIQSLSTFNCTECGKNFEIFNDLCAHMQSLHADLELYPCEDCNLILKTKSALELHIEGGHITQIDGLELDSFDFGNIPGATMRTSSYTLNQEKQTEKIVKDALKNDYEVSVNNDDQNATIRCSSGFYLQVAKPCFTTIKNGSVFTKASIAITLDEVKITNDKNRTEASRLLHFSFVSNLSSCGGVTIHLHHSTRTIQIQGSSVMPTKERSPVWFINTIVLPKFKDLAKAKQFAIKTTNTAVLDINSKKNKISSPPTSLPTASNHGNNTCNSCLQIFDTKSRPSICNNCDRYFHKTKCLREHTKACRPQSQQISSINTARASVPTLPSTVADTLNSVTAAASLPAAFSTMETPTSSSVTTARSLPSLCPPSSTSVITQHARLTGLQTLVSFVPHTSTNSGLPPRSIPVQPPQEPPTQAGLASQTRGNKKKQKLPPITNEQARISFLETELSAAQSRIVVLDKSIVDKDQELSVCWARIKILEEKQNKDILDKYSLNSSSFQRKCSPVPSPSRAPPTCSYYTPAAPCCSHPPPPPCSAAHMHHSAYHSCNHHNRTESNDLKRDIMEIRRDLDDIRNKINENVTTKVDDLNDISSTATAPPILTQQEQNMNDDEASIIEESHTNLNESHPNLNESIATVEELMSETNLPLNSQDPTIQQLLLEQESHQNLL